METESVFDNPPKVRPRKGRKCTKKEKKKCDSLKQKKTETKKQFEARKKKVCKCPEKKKPETGVAEQALTTTGVSVSSVGPTIVQQGDTGGSSTVNTLHRAVPRIRLKHGESKTLTLPSGTIGVRTPEFPEMTTPQRPFATDPHGQPVELGVQHDYTNTLYNHYGQVGIGQSTPTYFDHSPEDRMKAGLYHEVWDVDYKPPRRSELKTLEKPIDEGIFRPDTRTKKEKAETGPQIIDIELGPSLPDIPESPIGGDAPNIGSISQLFAGVGGLFSGISSGIGARL